MYAIAVFKSRNSTLNFFNLCQDEGINCALINTPQGANVGCGLSVKFNESLVNKAQRLVSASQIGGFAGLFRVSVIKGKTIVVRL